MNYNFQKIFLFIYLDALGVSCGMLDLQSLIEAHELLVAACGI